MTEIRKGIFRIKEDSDDLMIKLSKEFFEKEPIMEAIHEYSNNFNVKMNPLEDGFIGVYFSLKKDKNFDTDLIDNFSNRVIDYQIRKDLNRESGHIKEIIVEYAYSTIKKN